MCDRCITLKLAIQKGEDLAKSGFDALTTQRVRVFVEELKAELAALEAQLDHRTSLNN